MPLSNDYDYIIAGAGCAGLSLVMHMINSGKFNDKRILLVDKQEKKNNDRTWCFWETEQGLFESLVYQRWKDVWFHSDEFSKLLSLQPYEYKMIRGIDFYTYCLAKIVQQPNIDFFIGDIREIKSNKEETFLLLDDRKFRGQYIFNSILFDKPVVKGKTYFLLQHFKGWVIENYVPVFNPLQATLMDFRVDQRHGTTFVYVMPFTENKALVEYTLFTKNVLKPEEYDKELGDYIHSFLGNYDYKIVEEESGIIPMTNYPFAARDNNIINIGTAGGQTKASSGYTFRFIQKQAGAITNQLVKTGNPFVPAAPGKKRFQFYDSTLLYILQQQKLPGKKIFTDLFKKNKPQQVLRFLDNESSLRDEFKIISSLPTWPFLKAALKQI